MKNIQNSGKGYVFCKKRPKNPDNIVQKQTLKFGTSPYHYIGEFPPPGGIPVISAVKSIVLCQKVSREADRPGNLSFYVFIILRIFLIGRKGK